jgi:UDP-glucose:(heptosyl)LPS alpha-1,3-glucosyltransferase
MKIAVVLDWWDPRRGGLEHWAWQLVRWLGGRGHELHVVAFASAGSDPPPGTTIHTVPRPPSRLAAAAAISEYVRGLGADVVHDLGTGADSDVFQPQFGSRRLAIAGQHAARPWWQRWRRRLSPRERRHRAELRTLEAGQLASCRGTIVAVSHRIAVEFERAHGVPAQRIQVIPNGVDTSRFSPEACRPQRAAMRAAVGAGPGTLLVLVIAGNVLLKGVPAALRALQRLVARGIDARLLVVGRSEAALLAPLIGRLGLRSHVTLAGWVEDQLPCYAAADVFLLPSFYDACSLTALEAWACGLPVVTTRWNGASELMDDGSHGYVLREADDEREMEDALLRLLAPETRWPMADSARALALRHRIEDTFARLEALYASGVTQSGSFESRSR